MAILTAYTIVDEGLNTETAGVYAAAAASQVVPNTGRELIHIKNTSGGSITCTMTPNTYVGHTVSDVVITVGATTGEFMAGPFPQAAFNTTTDGIPLTWSATASVTIGVFRLP
ncbi:MAG: hypothetical protein WBC22_06535 [Sedimentisphaerales bacterium]